MNRYRLRQILLGPYKLLQRYRFRHEPEAIRAVLEELNYSRGILAYRAQGGQQERDHAAGLSKDSVAVDVGGYEGDWVRTIHQQCGCKVYVFEAFPWLAHQIAAAYARNPEVRVFDYGLAGEDKSVPFSVDGPGSTAFEHPTRNRPWDWEVQMRDVAAVFDELKLERIDLLKINIEGGEYELLQRMIECKLLERCREIRVQFHDWIPEAIAMRRQIRRNLAQTHREKWNYPFVWECWVRNDSPTIR